MYTKNDFVSRSKHRQNKPGLAADNSSPPDSTRARMMSGTRCY